MNDRAVELLEQYEIEVLRTRKGRGAILCETNRGCLILKEYAGSQERIALQDRLLKQVAGYRRRKSCRTGKARYSSGITTVSGMC